MEIFDSNGEVKEYIPVSERLPAFLEQYGPDKGYAIKASSRLHPGYKTVQQVDGLPNLIVFEATLVNEKGKTVASGSALRQIDVYSIGNRVWESGETAALQRLMARLGHGSDNLLADEQMDMTVRGVSFQVKPDQDSAPSPKAMAQVEPPLPVEEKPAEKPVEQAKPVQQASEEVSEYLLRQIRHLANLRGIEPPEVSTKSQAKEALRTLRSTHADA